MFEPDFDGTFRYYCVPNSSFNLIADCHSQRTQICKAKSSETDQTQRK